MSELVFVNWYCKTAVYRGGRLLYFGECSHHRMLLTALGYRCRNLPEVPTHDIPAEFDRAPGGHWQPPERLADLERQQAAWRERQRRERIVALRKELASLEDGPSAVAVAPKEPTP